MSLLCVVGAAPTTHLDRRLERIPHETARYLPHGLQR
jgi:hypothetical protein